MVWIGDEPLVVEDCFSSVLGQPGHRGALASFVGLVRGVDGAPLRLTLTHHERLTRSGIDEAVALVSTRFALTSLDVWHRIGTMHEGEPIVVVIAASPHRGAAIDAVDCMMEMLKNDAFFWKKESVGGTSRWIEPGPKDRERRRRWDFVLGPQVSAPVMEARHG